MAWEAPNLFGQYLQNTGKNAGAVFSFISQLMGRQDRASERDKADKQAAMVGTEELSRQRETNDYLNQVSEGDASSGVFVPPTKVDWVTEQVKGMFLGRAMADPIQYQNALLRNKELLARSIGTSLENTEKLRQLEEDMESRAELSKLSGLPDAEIATKPLTGKKLYDAALSKMQNDVTSRSIARANDSENKFWAETRHRVFQASPEDSPKFRETFKDGNPTAATSDLYATLKPKVEAWEREQALLKPSVISSQTTAASREKIAEQRYGSINGKKVYHAGDKFFTLDENNVATTVFDASKGKVTALDRAEFADALKSKHNAEMELKELAPDSPQFDAQTQLWNRANKQIQSIRKKYEQDDSPDKTKAKPSAPNSGKLPTRAMASDYVNKFGKEKAIEQLKKDGYETSGYAD